MRQLVLRTFGLGVLLLTASGCPEAAECSASQPCPGTAVCVAGRCTTPDAGVAGGAGGGMAGGMAGGVAGGRAGGTAGGGAGGTAGGRSDDGERCDTALPLVPGAPATNTTVGARNDVALRCTGFLNAGPDLVYALSVPAGQRLVARLSPDAPADGGFVFDPSLSLVAGPASQCVAADAGACLGGRDEQGEDTVTWTNEGSEAQDVFLVVGSYLTEPDLTAGTTFEGGFTLLAQLEVPGAGDRCATADVVPPNGTTPSTLQGMGPDVSGRGAGCALQAGPDRVFELDVPAGERLSATATPSTDGGLDVVVNVIAGPAAQCLAMPLVCLASADDGFRNEADTATWLNATTSSQRVFVVVGSYFAQPGDEPFTLTTDVRPPPPGDTCATAERLDAGVLLTGQTLGGYANDLEQSRGCASDTVPTGAERFFVVDVPAGKQLSVTATPQPTLDTLLSLVDGASTCVEPVSCLARAAPSAALVGQSDVVTFTNKGSAARSVIVVVDSLRGTSGSFDLLATLADPPMGDFCANALPLPVGASVTGTTVGATNDYEPFGNGCSADSEGPDVAWSLLAAAGVRTTVTVTPTITDGGFAPSLQLVTGPASACEAVPLVCSASADAVPNLPRQASVVNGQAVPQSVFVLVDAPRSAGAFTLSASTSPLLPNDVCSSATTTLPVSTPASPQVLVGQSLTGFVRDYGCISSSRGPDRVYPLTLPALERVTIAVTPTPGSDGGSFDPTLALVEGPAAACDGPAQQCLDAIDDGAQATAEGLVVQNVGPARQAFVVVSAWEPAPIDSTFSLSAVAEPIPAGDVCERATPVLLTNTLSGSVQGASRDYLRTVPVSCQSYSGADVVFQVSFSTSFSVTVTPDAASDVVVNVLDGPASACATATSCLASSDATGLGGAEAVALTNPMPMTRTVYVVVSRFSSGPMTFSFAATVN
ncbi:MAG: hypothetical protein SFW67_25555 [Myxococcaceae bacterium]|nr:hypothetical protein [Myxococcaceae bacterium]